MGLMLSLGIVRDKRFVLVILLILIGFLFAPFVLAVNASYNSTFSAPYCGDSRESPCIAPSSLLKSANTYSGTAEPNQPNTIDSCNDGTNGAYQSDENVENITITDLSNSNFETGDNIRVNFTIHCYDSNSDRYAVYYTNVTSSPLWKRITSGNPICSGQGFNSYSESFSLDGVEGYHAVRVIIEYGENIASACPTTSGYADKDDVVFNVASATGDSASPNVFDLRPVADAKYNATNTIEIGSNVTDNVKVQSVLANVTMPNGTVSQLVLSNTSNWYNASYIVPNAPGRYNVTFIASDNSSNVNDTEETYFIGKPFFSSLILNSSSGTNLSEENLTAYPSGLTPSDSKIVYDWKMNGSSFALLNMPFENGSAVDYSTFGNDGIVSGAVFNSTGGYDGFGAYEFDGSDDQINISYSSSLVNNNTNEMTIMVWVKPLSYGGYKEALRKERSYHFANTGSSWDIGFKDTSNTNKGVTIDNSAVLINQWTHLVLTTNGTDVFAYVNGGLNVSTNVSAFTIGNNVNNSLYLGNYGTSSEAGTLSRYFNGSIDDVMVFNRSLSAEQISALYNNRIDLIVSQETNVSDVWNLCGTPTGSGIDGDLVCSNNLTIIVSGEACSPVFDEDWFIGAEEVCDGVVFDLGVGDIILENGGILNLIGNSNFTAKSLEINRTGDAVFIESGSRLILG